MVLLDEESGQASVEYALVLVASLAMLAALAALWHKGGEGTLVDGAISAASHLVEGTLQDVLLF